MAEINVQHKKSSAWLWILGIVALALVTLALGGMWNDDDDIDVVATGPVAMPPSDTAPPTGVREPAPADVAAFLAFTNTPVGSAGSTAGPAHEYAADGIRRLARALNAVIAQQDVVGAPVREQLSAFQTKADRIQTDPQSMQHSEGVREVFTSAADLMSAVQQDRWPGSNDLMNQIAEVRTAATAVNGATPLLEQTAAVETFFDRAAVALRSISERK